MIKWLFVMILLHIINDFNMQGLFGNLKQKSWWIENASDEMYKYDYIVALICHSLSWSIMIMLPTMFTWAFEWWMIPINTVMHALTDDAKANKKIINLITDQVIHLAQIILTFMICYRYY